MQETQEMLVRSLNWENPPEKGMATHSSILNLGNPLDRGAWQTIVHVVAKSQTWMSTYAMPVIFFLKKERKALDLGMISRSFHGSISFQFLVAGTAAQDLCCRECRDPSGVGPVSLVGPKTPPVDQQL